MREVKPVIYPDRYLLAVSDFIRYPNLDCNNPDIQYPSTFGHILSINYIKCK